MSSFWQGKQVLVTGAGGFIGSHLIERLLSEGAQVRAFLRYTSRNDLGMLRQLSHHDLDKVELIGGDLRDAHAVQLAVKGSEIVFHLGAIISIPYSYRHPVETAETNFMGTLNILTACQSERVSRLIHTSSSEVYGSALRVPIDESHPLQGQSPYSASKIGADKLAESFYCAYGLPVVTVRPFNTFGPRQSARAVIPAIITQALALDVIHLGNLDTTRDFTFISDTVNGFLHAAEADGVEGQVFNLGTGQDIRIGELAQKIIDMIGRPVSILQDAQRLRPGKSEVLRLLSDNSLARTLLGWKPEITLDDGLRNTIVWVSSHLDQYQVGKYQF
jgi:NAD dependent epimerase/dehydratase